MCLSVDRAKVDTLLLHGSIRDVSRQTGHSRPGLDRHRRKCLAADLQRAVQANSPTVRPAPRRAPKHEPTDVERAQAKAQRLIDASCDVAIEQIDPHVQALMAEHGIGADVEPDDRLDRVGEPDELEPTPTAIAHVQAERERVASLGNTWASLRDRALGILDQAKDPGLALKAIRELTSLLKLGLDAHVVQQREVGELADHPEFPTLCAIMMGALAPHPAARQAVAAALAAAGL